MSAVITAKALFITTILLKRLISIKSKRRIQAMGSASITVCQPPQYLRGKATAAFLRFVKPDFPEHFQL
ncbi:MAG TPA: hypothetical protein VHG11_07110, partial [Pseudorhizobium sp.]|nr:hypothetical protein [Pseudorhizobium sp.]